MIFIIRVKKVDFSVIDVPNYKNDGGKSSRIFLKMHNFSDFAANMQSMIDCLLFKTNPRMLAQFIWKLQAN